MLFLKRKHGLKNGDTEVDQLSERLVTITNPGGMAAEAYRTLRTSLLYTRVDTPPKVVAITSPGPRDGKSTVCANLGVVLAHADQRTLIMDSDLRNPVLHKIFELRNNFGVVDVLVGERSLQEVWHEPVAGLKVLTAGRIPPNPAELLSSKRYAAFVEATRAEFDYVLINTPPIEIASDSAIIASSSDGAVLVLDAQGTRKYAVQRSIHSLEAVGATVLGTVMNNVKSSYNLDQVY